MLDDSVRRLPTPVRVAPNFADEYPSASARATECHINLGVTWETVEPVMTRLLDRYGLTMSSFNVLEILRGAWQPLPPSVITDHMLVTRGAMTKIVDSLERDGLVRRLAHPEDRRMLLVEITEHGRRLTDELLHRLHSLEPVWFDVLTPEEQDTLIVLLGKVQGRFQELQATFHPEPTGVTPAGQ